MYYYESECPCHQLNKLMLNVLNLYALYLANDNFFSC